MIDANVGLPRSGKSYSAVEFTLIPALDEGRQIVTNMPLNMDAIQERWPDAKIKFIDLDEFAHTIQPDGKGGHRIVRPRANMPELKMLKDEVPPGAQCIFDELWRIWPSGMKTDRVPDDHKSFLAEHGHMVGEDGRATDILLITQDLGQIASFVKMLVDKTAITTKLDGLGSGKRAKVNFYQGSVTGQRGPAAQHIRTTTIKYKPEVYKLYKSHTMSVTGKAGVEKRSDSRMSLWKSPIFMFVLFGLIMSPFLIMGTVRGLKPDTWQEPAPTPQPVFQPQQLGEPQTMHVQQTQPPEPTPTPGPEYSGKWKLAGTVQKVESGEGFALVQAPGGYVRLYLDACKPITNSPDLQCKHEGKLVHVATGYGYLSGKTTHANAQ